jgi:succinate-acetate transporter protein
MQGVFILIRFELSISESRLLLCWEIFTFYQYSETNVMHLSFSFLNIKSLYIFWALGTCSSSVGTTQAALGILRACMSVVCTRIGVVQEAGWAPGPVWTGAENLASTGI